MQQKITLRIALILFLALAAHQYYGCKKVDLERQVLIQTGSATDITAGSAVLQAQVVDAGESGAVSSYGFVYSTTSSPSLSDQVLEKGTNLTTGRYVMDAGSLDNNTTYYFRAYASQGGDAVYYGSIKSFTTLIGNITLPTVTTGAASNITQTGATVTGNVTDDGGGSVSQRGFCIGLQTNPDISGTTTVDGSGTGQFSHSFSGLDNNTTYNVRAYAINETGTAYGQNIQFTTGNGGGTINEWLFYDSGENVDAVGTQGYDFDAVIMFPKSFIQDYVGTRVTHIRFFPNTGTTATFSVEIYTGGDPNATNPDYFEEIPHDQVTPGQWTEYHLTDDFVIGSADSLWVGLYVSMYFSGEYPMGIDGGPAVTGFGDLTYDYNNELWFALSELSTPINANWNIEVFVTNESGEKSVMKLPEEYIKPVRRPASKGNYTAFRSSTTEK